MVRNHPDCIIVRCILAVLHPSSKQFRDALQKGDKVMTIGGIHGKVHEVKETTIVITVDNNVNIEVEKSALVANGTQVGQA